MRILWEPFEMKVSQPVSLLAILQSVILSTSLRLSIQSDELLWHIEPNVSHTYRDTQIHFIQVTQMCFASPITLGCV